MHTVIPSSSFVLAPYQTFIINNYSNELQDFDWDSRKSSMILSSFFWGYILTQLPSGYFASTFSARKLLACGIFMCSVFNLLIPVSAIHLNWVAVICCRVATGMFQGCLLPCIQTLLSRWVPPAERATLGNALIFIKALLLKFSFEDRCWVI